MRSVLSLFDGASCGQLALNRANKSYQNYYASEIDKHAVQVTQNNYPDTFQLGDITRWKEWDIDWSSIDLIMGGSPCQGFSLSGKQKGFDDPRSRLFFYYIDILEHAQSFNKNVKFLLENVKMSKRNLDIITSFLKVQPLKINSNLVSAQNRDRYYWFNWHAKNPIDKKVRLADILTSNGGGYLYSPRSLEFINCYQKGSIPDLSYFDNFSNERTVGDISKHLNFNIEESVAAMRGRYIKGSSGKTKQFIEFRHDKRSNTLTTVCKDNIVVPIRLNSKISAELLPYRNLTPIECERLQTVPDNYTYSVSNTQRYKILGNGWTVDIISHLLSFLEK